MVCLSRLSRLLLAGCALVGTATRVFAAETNQPTANAEPDDSSKVVLQEITVTATRRTQSLQSVPYNIAALSSDDITQSGVGNVNGLTQLVAGLETIDTGPDSRGGNNQFSMRGLRTNGTGSEVDAYRSGTVAPVSTYLGETPVFFPLELKDLDRVEVLKGPQGTLYGSGSLAGTIRFIPKQPDFDKFEGGIDLQGGGTKYSGQLNGSVDGFVNLPITDGLAARVATGYERLGGFIDEVDLVRRSVPGNQASPPMLAVPGDPLSAYALAPVRKDTNTSEEWYVRPELRWRITERVSAEFLYMHQRVAVADAQIQNASYPGGTFQFDSATTDPNAVAQYRAGGPYKATADMLNPSEEKVDLASIVVTANLGASSLTSASSVYRNQGRSATTYVSGLEYYNPDGTLATNYYDYFYNYPRGNEQLYVHQRDQSFVQEVRLVSTWDKPIDYLVGAYFQAEHYNFESRVVEPGYTDYLTSVGYTSPVLPRPNGDLVFLFPEPDTGYKFEDRALFGELTWHITPQWQVTGGARVFRQDFTSFLEGLDYYYVGAGTTDLDVTSHNQVNDHILKFNTAYDFTPQLKLYATYSEGFRRGGANALPLSGSFASLPQLIDYKPDKSRNYEMGVKGQLFDRALRYTADVFWINLDNFQFNSFSSSGYATVYNGTQARSKGVELETEYQVMRQLTVGLSYTYTDAKVQKGFAIDDYVSAGAPQLTTVAAVAAGERLPQAPYNTANAMANYTIPLGPASVLLHADVTYRDNAASYIDPTSARYWVIPSYILTNVRATYYSAENWSTDLFVNNLTNETVYSGGFGTLQTMPNVFQNRYVGRPRTYGLGLHYKW